MKVNINNKQTNRQINPNTVYPPVLGRNKKGNNELEDISEEIIQNAAQANMKEWLSNMEDRTRRSNIHQIGILE